MVWVSQNIFFLEKIYCHFRKKVKFSEKIRTFVKKLRNLVKWLLSAQLFFFCQNINIKEQEKKYSKSHRIKFWIPEFFHKMYWIFSENGFLALFLVFLHLSKSHKSNVMVHLYFVFTLLFHIFISCKVPIKIKNKKFEHNFF